MSEIINICYLLDTHGRQRLPTVNKKQDISRISSITASSGCSTSLFRWNPGMFSLVTAFLRSTRSQAKCLETAANKRIQISVVQCRGHSRWVS